MEKHLLFVRRIHILPLRIIIRALIQVSAKFACSQPKVTWIGKLEIKKLAA